MGEEWSEYVKLVTAKHIELAELQRIVNEIRVDLAIVKTKAAFIGAISSTLFTLILNYFFHKVMK